MRILLPPQSAIVLGRDSEEIESGTESKYENEVQVEVRLVMQLKHSKSVSGQRCPICVPERDQVEYVGGWEDGDHVEPREVPGLNAQLIGHKEEHRRIGET